jgi:hypothetical protein
MPNWCNNQLTLSGSPTAIDHAVNQLKGEWTSIDLHRIDPMPAILINKPDNGVELIDPALLYSTPTRNDLHDSDTWWSWRIRHWGTKSPVAAPLFTTETLQSGLQAATTDFESAWSPPLAAFTTLSRQNPGLTISLTYSEPMLEFSGVCRWAYGQIIHHVEHSHAA